MQAHLYHLKLHDLSHKKRRGDKNHTLFFSHFNQYNCCLDVENMSLNKIPAGIHNKEEP